MLTLEDCLELSELTEDEVLIIAEHEHMPEIVAAELGSSLVKTPKGVYQIKQMMLEELEKAAAHGHRDKEKQIDKIYARFNATHPTPRVL